MKVEKFKMLLYLKKSGPDKSGKAPIMGRITVNRTMAQFGCKLSCTPELWNPRESRLNGKSKEAVETNAKIEKLLLAYLRKKDLLNGTLSYRRRKTGQQLFIKWERCMQEIVDKYPINETEYLLPIITKHDEDYRKQYTNELHRVNHLLKKIGKLLDLPIPLTMYVGRHSWASIAKSRNVPVSVISEGMGHDSENTTQIYLASLDTSVVDKANKKILDLL